MKYLILIISCLIIGALLSWYFNPPKIITETKIEYRDIEKIVDRVIKETKYADGKVVTEIVERTVEIEKEVIKVEKEEKTITASQEFEIKGGLSIPDLSPIGGIGYSRQFFGPIWFGPELLISKKEDSLSFLVLMTLNYRF
jgi:hypothetical protein